MKRICLKGRYDHVFYFSQKDNDGEYLVDEGGWEESDECLEGVADSYKTYPGFALLYL